MRDNRICLYCYAWSWKRIWKNSPGRRRKITSWNKTYRNLGWRFGLEERVAGVWQDGPERSPLEDYYIITNYLIIVISLYYYCYYIRVILHTSRTVHNNYYIKVISGISNVPFGRRLVTSPLTYCVLLQINTPVPPNSERSSVVPTKLSAILSRDDPIILQHV